MTAGSGGAPNIERSSRISLGDREVTHILRTEADAVVDKHLTQRTSLMRTGG